MAIKVIQPGLATTVQDLGRPGYYHIGIPLSGGMDRFALRAANMLVGNREGAGVLEAVFMGPELEFTDNATVAVTGAALPPKVDGEARPTWTSFKVKKGQTLAFDFLKGGARAYIAVSGGIDVPVVLGSRSTYALGALGGFKGRPLQGGDELPTARGRGAKEGRTVKEKLRRMPSSPAELRMMTGLYWHRITEAAGKHFFEDTWKVALEADRIGYRFKGGQAAGVRAAQAALRCRFGPLQHRRCLLSLRLDPGTGRHRADRPAPRRGVGGRVFHGRNGHFRRHGPDRPASAPYARTLRAGDDGAGPQGPCSPQQAARTDPGLAQLNRGQSRKDQFP